jgi:hypothetical protein
MTSRVIRNHLAILKNVDKNLENNVKIMNEDEVFIE